MAAKKRKKSKIKVSNKRKRRKGFFAKILNRSRGRQRQEILPPIIKPWISGALMFLIALFILLSFFDLAGVAGRTFIKAFSFLFGKANFILPLVFVLGGFACFSRRLKSRLSITLAMFFILAGASGIFSIFDLDKLPDITFHFFYSGVGGWLGNLLAWPLMKIFGFWVSGIVFCFLLLISIFIFWYYLKPEKREYDYEDEDEEEITQQKPFIHKVFAPKFKVNKVEEYQKKIEIKDVNKNKEQANKNIETKIFKTDSSIGKEKFLISANWNLPPLKLLSSDSGSPEAGDVNSNSEIIKRTLDNFDIPVEMSGVNIGPTVTQYAFKPAEGVKLSKITTLNNNLALALAAHPLRIEAPIPGKSLVGIEVPNKTRTIVRLKGLFSNREFSEPESRLLFSVGRDVVGTPFYSDLAKMPHLLVAGATGSGKTIALSSIMLSLLYRNSPKQLRFILVDPKRVEFSGYKDLPHLLCPVIYDVGKTLIALRWLINEMESRFEILSKIGARHIAEYNERLLKNNTQSDDNKIMPYIVVIVDELADLMAAKGRDIEAGIVKLAQKARAVGIHLILATQRPSVEVITGLIKANITCRIALQVASQVDSRTILDTSGAEKLLGGGDLLFISAQISKPKRIQGAYVSTKEIKRVVDFIHKNNKSIELEGDDSLRDNIEAEMQRAESFGSSVIDGTEPLDPVYEDAKRLIIESGKASASFLQRKLRIGYARAARLLDVMEERGIVGPAQGAKPREVMQTIEQAIAEEAREGEEELDEEQMLEQGAETEEEDDDEMQDDEMQDDEIKDDETEEEDKIEKDL
ncbi:DNA translocase FtsK [Patescibacteria group bacterium]|nr:DNA translocase FtsK [Patescibacteria group bacterium]MBU4022974.1 DNA translocase FtsK [Patescibacteria group bacterium]MBU4078546.1 DNA translocase FtsK [Patescibacteria group bacterium]